MRIGRGIVWMAMVAAQEVTPAAGNSGELTLTVLVYNYAKLSAYELENSMALAQEIFRNGGISTKWVECAAVQESRRGLGCPEILAASDVVLNIVSSVPLGSANRAEAMGSAVHDEEGHPATIAYVFPRRMKQIVPVGCRCFEVLGHVMAHEVGHLLLGVGSHSKTGIMKAQWTVGELTLRPGSVTFTPEQAQRINNNISWKRFSRLDSRATPAVFPSISSAT